ncbi:MAG: hypothetical protein HC857_05585 [Synechococcales cyanobacterium RU_4_20]|nr:hypothetical protein [Synechococcales cyanobacterium RU_4_20]NJR69507.1 hypothetical protein [Synechococcales cyanobacterium CRU_2_2]
MSLDQAHAFYQALNTDPHLYAKYLSHCSHAHAIADRDRWGDESSGSLQNNRNWSEADILSFATHQGYHFSLSDLYQVWFGQHDYRTAHMEQVGMKLGAIATLNRQLA